MPVTKPSTTAIVEARAGGALALVTATDGWGTGHALRDVSETIEGPEEKSECGRPPVAPVLSPKPAGEKAQRR